MNVKALDTGVVYRNPAPHIRSVQAFFPSLVRLSSGEILCGLDIGSAFEAHDVRTHVSRSLDNGSTWSAPEPLCLLDETEYPKSMSCRLSHGDGDQIVGLAHIWDRSRAEHGLANPDTEGFVSGSVAMVDSKDGGHTWNAPRELDLPLAWHEYEICSPIKVLPSGRWTIPTALWPNWEGATPFGCKAILFSSDDHGQTWTGVADVMNGWDDKIAYYEQKQLVLGDGRLLALCWVVDHKTKTNLPNRFAFSYDDGRSFSTPQDTPLNGETCTTIALEGNKILCLYRRADQYKGLWAHIAEIEGDTWKPISDVPLWGTNVSAHETTQESLLAQMSTIRFGCPTVVKLDDGQFLVAFFCVEEAVFNIRWLKLQVS